MVSKKTINKKPTTLELKSLSFADLYSMYVFVSGLNNITVGKKQETKQLIKNKFNEIETELYNRVFGKNPFVSEPLDKIVDITGQNPIDVINSFSKKEETSPETFIVATNKPQEK